MAAHAENHLFERDSSHDANLQTLVQAFDGEVTMTQAASWLELAEQGAPDLMKAVSGTRESIMAEGALSHKNKTLMTMLCDALLGHDGGVQTIANRARAAGASEEEIAETVGVAFLMGGLPALVTGSNAFKR
jgi:alkylhydroperoxidase/carboxymuconolactone decarboxylase family protein YurZ